jgi:hypothetical protein
VKRVDKKSRERIHEVAWIMKQIMQIPYAKSAGNQYDRNNLSIMGYEAHDGYS